ncbi:hypothetical protein JCM3765_000508 [Sporobolomyces pararoseus]
MTQIEPPPLSILDSLHSSRQNLLQVALPPFSSPSLPQLQHPPHQISHFATTNVTIGPHSFTGTKFFLVEWTTPTQQQPPRQAAPPPPASASPPRRSASLPKASPSEAITPSLIQRLNAASLTDPGLANLLRRAATGQASPEELGALSKKIEELRKEEEAEQNPTPPAPAATETVPSETQGGGVIPHPALVIEFAESAPNRFLIPDHFLCVVLTPRSASSTPMTTVALLLSFFVFPPDRAVRGREHEFVATEGGIPPPPPVPVDMIIEGVKEDEKDKFMRASRLGRPRDTGLENWWKNTIASVPPRVHVVHQQPKPKLPQLPEGASLSRTGSEGGATVPMKRGASGTPMSTGAGANKRGKTVIAAPPPPPARRINPRSSTTRSRSSTHPVDYRDDTPEPSPPPEESDYPPPISRNRNQNRGTPNSLAGSPAPTSSTAPVRKRPGPKPGWRQARALAEAEARARGEPIPVPTKRGGGRGGKRKKKEASSDEDDWSGIKVIE